MLFKITLLPWLMEVIVQQPIQNYSPLGDGQTSETASWHITGLCAVCGGRCDANICLKVESYIGRLKKFSVAQCYRGRPPLHGKLMQFICCVVNLEVLLDRPLCRRDG
eukprot:TRINITY_DN8066_c1_g2_i12.p2 TRINITY_DN8066_c1_g2~~TRINITY_DN8066_c1_g2_i12.p2  ORF type:complete len:108 (-),score=3.78 TRINITY_DN8066_c1_g2_i12:736-1059(-)